MSGSAQARRVVRQKKKRQSRAAETVNVSGGQQQSTKLS